MTKGRGKFMTKRKLLNLLIGIAILAFYEGTGFLFQLDFLKVFAVTPSGFHIGIAGLLLCLLTAFGADRALRFYRIKNGG